MLPAAILAATFLGRGMNEMAQPVRKLGPSPQVCSLKAALGLGFSTLVRRFRVDDFELWMPRVIVWLFAVAGIIAAYWIGWFSDRSLVAAAHTAGYVSFEQAFPLADALLLGGAVTAAIQLWRRRPSASMWLHIVGGAGIYLGALDILYDLQNGIYGTGVGGKLELTINVTTVLSSLGVMSFGWRSRHWLVEHGLQPRDRSAAASPSSPRG